MIASTSMTSSRWLQPTLYQGGSTQLNPSCDIEQGGSGIWAPADSHTRRRLPPLVARLRLYAPRVQRPYAAR